MTKPPREPSTTVLVVEDEESFVDALTIGLKREGFRVEVARDGAEAYRDDLYGTGETFGLVMQRYGRRVHTRRS